MAEQLGVPYVSSGELLRGAAKSSTATGREAARYLDRGELVPDDLVLATVRDALSDQGVEDGYVLDGFPRTLSQARRADAFLRPDLVIHLAVPDDVARARIGRRVDPTRTDDRSDAVVERRLREFRDRIEPVLRYYSDRGILRTVDADRPVDAVRDAIIDALRTDGACA